MFLRLKNKKGCYKIEVSKKKLKIVKNGLIGLTLFGHFDHKNDSSGRLLLFLTLKALIQFKTNYNINLIYVFL